MALFLDKLKRWISAHPIVSFVLLTFLITWGLGFSYIGVMQRGVIFLAPLVAIATCGPALAGIIITVVINGPEERQAAKFPQWAAFLILLVVVTAFFLANNILLQGAPFSLEMAGLTLLLFSPPAAWILSTVFSRRPSISEFLQTLIPRKESLGWLLLALILIPALVLISLPVSRWLGKTPVGLVNRSQISLSLLGLIAVKFFYQLAFFNLSGEEIGWSGFLRPRLQAHFSPLVASLIFGAIWPLWHFFLWYAEGQAVLTPGFWLESYLMHLPAAILIGWIYNRSGGSILAAGIAHAAANTVFFFISLNMPVYKGIELAFLVVIIVLDKMWQKLPAEHPAVSSG